MRQSSSILIGLILLGLLLAGCAGEKRSQWPDRAAYERNPLLAEATADLVLDYVTSIQIEASDRKKPIEDPAVLRAIDKTFIEARSLQLLAHERQDAGKEGMVYGVNNNFGQGQALLYKETLYLGPLFEVSVAPDTFIYLAQHVAPHTSEELFSEPTKEIGPLASPFGPQEYFVGALANDEWNKFRTVAFYSTSLKRVVALAQIRGMVK
jgi:hypothetical protein